MATSIHTRRMTALLGVVLFRQGKFEEAEDCCRRSLAVTEKMDGKGKLSQANTHFILGEVLASKEKWKKPKRTTAKPWRF